METNAPTRMTAPIRRTVQRAWRDLLSVYYANTPIWRWLKSAALVFLGFFAWTGSNVLLSVRPDWTVLHYTMAYGFLLVVWGPFTHFVVVPLTIRLRREGTHPLSRWFARNSGKTNLSVFFALVVVLGTVTPGVMLLEFSPTLPGGDGAPDASGDLVCEETDELVTCQVENAEGFDHVVVTSGGEEVARADEPPYEFEVEKDELAVTRTGLEYRVDYRDADGETLRRQVRTVPG